MNDKIEKSITEFFGDEKLSSIEKGNKFLTWVLSYIFDKTDSELEDDDLEEGVLICNGANTLGIDAGFKDNIGLHIIQTKYGSSHSIDEVHNFINNVPRLLKRTDLEINENSKKILNCFDECENLYFYYITNEDLTNEQFSNIKLRVKNIEKEINTSDKVNIRILVLYSYNINDYIEQNTYSSNIPRKFRNTEVSMLLEKYFLNKQKDTIIAEVSLKVLAEFVKKSKKFVFYSNIRNYLGKNDVNKNITETYKSYPKDFWFYNNGITIVCDNFKDLTQVNNDGTGRVNIVTPQIVNGCQTASTIYNCWCKEDTEKRKTKEGTILVKIIKDTNEKRKEITRYTNNQTAVTGKDLFALEDFHYKLQKNFEKIGYNYAIQRKNKLKSGKGCKVYNYLFDKKFKNNFYAKDIAQSLAAGMFFLPGKARSICNIAPGGQYYEKLFNDKSPDDPRFYLFPYGVTYYSKYILNYKKKDKFKSTSLLYTTIYFKLILRVFKDLEIVDEDVKCFIDCNQEDVIDKIDKIFSNSKVNEKLLNTTDSILKNLLKDSTIKNEKIKDNLPKFLKSTVETDNTVLSILDSKIMDEFEDENIDLDEIKEIIN